MAAKTSHLLRPLIALVALVAAMAALLLLVYGASPTHAASSCSTTSGTTTCNFGPTGAEQTFVVPEGVNTIHLVATGASGAVGPFEGSSAGRGARVSADLAVSPGQKLYVNVGGTPTGGSNCKPSTVACNGGFNGGGTSEDGGGGGGASDVRFAPREQNNSLFSRLIVAAGGGGSGGLGPDAMPCIDNFDHISSGAGGDAGSDGGDGLYIDVESTCTPSEGTGGGAGTQTAGGGGARPPTRAGMSKAERWGRVAAVNGAAAVASASSAGALGA
jgi:hypothetical protein